MIRHVRLLICTAVGLLLASCGSVTPPAYYSSFPPGDTKRRQLPHYPVARQGNLTAWLASDHVRAGGEWLYAPDDPTPKHPIVGIIRASAMPEAAKHDGCFLIASGYDGPLFDLWEGTEEKGWLFIGSPGWINVRLHQDKAVNTWVKVPAPYSVGPWSGLPVVIGDPARPDAIAGAMWYRSNPEPNLGGTTSTRMLKRWLGKLRLADFVKP